MLAGIVVPFFLSPYTVHCLGNAVYGIWILVVSSVSYLHLLDFGLRSAVITFIAKARTQGLPDESRRVVSGAFWIRVLTSVFILILALIAAVVFPRLFHVPAELRAAARAAVWLTGLGLAFTLMSGVPSAVLAAQHRFDLLSYVMLSRTLVRAAGFVVILHFHHGIAALAAWEASIAVALCGILGLLCAKQYPELSNFLRAPEADVIRRLWQYSAYAFLITVGGVLIYYSDNLVVGLFEKPAVVTFYAIAANLILYTREAVAAMSNTFVPIASSYDAQGKKEHLRSLLVRGSRASLAVCLPIGIILFVRGGTFIGLWMGRDYAELSSALVRILLLNQVLSIANLTINGISYGLEKHRPIASWILIEAVSNLALSVFLVQRIGVYGVAWGTVIPGVVINLVCWPRYAKKLLDVSYLDYFWNGWGWAALTAIPFALACSWQENHLSTPTLLVFCLQTAAILPFCILPSALLFRRELARYIPQRFRLAF